MGPAATRIQRWFRGRRVLMKFLRWVKRRRRSRQRHFKAWWFLWRCQRFRHFQLKLRFFKALQTEAAETKEVLYLRVRY